MRKLFLFFITISYFGIYAQEKLNESNERIEPITDTIQFNKAMNQLLDNIERNETLKSLKITDQLIKEGEELEYDMGLGKVHFCRARLFMRRDEQIKAVQSYELAESYFKNNNFIKELAKVYNDRYVAENEKGNLEKSADFLLEAKMYYEKLADSTGLVTVYNNLGILHARLKKYNSSEVFFKKAITIRKEIGMLKKMGLVMNNLAFMYSQYNKTDEAKIILKESLIRNKKDSLTKSVAHTYNIMAQIALDEKEYELARKYYDTTFQVASSISSNRLLNTAKQQLGYLAILLKDYKKAEQLLQEVREEFIKTKSTDLLLKNYKLSSKLDSTKGNFSAALVWQEKYQKLSDERMTSLSSKNTERAEVRHQAELEQLRIIDEQEIRQEQSKAELFRYRMLTVITLGVLALCLLFAFWIIKTRKERKKLIVRLNESNQVKNKLFSIISHDLKNEIHGLEGSLNLMKENEISTEEFEEIVPLLADRTNQTSILLNNLLNWSKSQLKELSANPVSFDVSELISSKFMFFKPKANQKKIKLINLLHSTNVYADKDMIAIVAQNLIANAIKFCEPGDSISLISREKENHYEIGFADTGIGIDPSNINKLFAEETFTTNGTQNESGTGLGLKICKELVELNKGNIKVESKPGEGSTFFISLPKTAA